MVIMLKAIVIGYIAMVTIECKPQNPKDAQIINNDFDLNELGIFFFNVDTSDGFHHHANGHVENRGSENEALAVRGLYWYTAPDGVKYTVEYIADKTGFHPYGKHIPQFGTPPPLIAQGGQSCAASLCGTGLG